MSESPRVLGGRYEVGELLGRGGMAEVRAGRDRVLGRGVAIKLLRPDVARDPVFLARFRREAQSTALLSHPGVVTVYDTGEDAGTAWDGSELHTPYIVMEHVQGRTVRDLLDEAAAAGDRGLSTQRAVEITAGVLTALQAAHDAGIVHRDVKPANVMVTPSGGTKVMDFGIARAVADSSATMTQTSAVIGTAQYLSPEQARGEVVDARTDLYSTGCLLYELLTGRPPFVGESPFAVAYQHVRELPAPPSQHHPAVDDALDQVVLTALSKDRDDRHPDADAFREDLLAAASGRRTSARATAGTTAAAVAATAATHPTEQLPARPGAPRGHRRRAVALAVGVLAVVLAVAGWLPGRAPDRQAEASTGATATADPSADEQAESRAPVVLTSADGPSAAVVPTVTGEPQAQVSPAAAPSPDAAAATASPAVVSAPAQTPSAAPSRSADGQPTGGSSDASSRPSNGAGSAPSAPEDTPQPPRGGGAGQGTSGAGAGEQPSQGPSQGPLQDTATGASGKGQPAGVGRGATDGAAAPPGRAGEQQGQGAGQGQGQGQGQGASQGQGRGHQG